MKIKIIMLSCLLVALCSDVGLTQVGRKKTGLSQPQGPVGSKDAPGKPPPALALPDLIVKRIVYDGKTEDARILVANIGKAQAKAFNLGFGCLAVISKGVGSDGKEFELKSTAVGTVSVSLLNAGENRWVSLKMGKISNIEKCSAEADDEKVVTESNESNNTLSIK